MDKLINPNALGILNKMLTEYIDSVNWKPETPKPVDLINEDMQELVRLSMHKYARMFRAYENQRAEQLGKPMFPPMPVDNPNGFRKFSAPSFDCGQCYQLEDGRELLVVGASLTIHGSNVTGHVSFRCNKGELVQIPVIALTNLLFKRTL